jgi:hypothetical protein
MYGIRRCAGSVVGIRLCSVEPGQRIREERKDLLQWDIIVNNARKARGKLFRVSKKFARPRRIRLTTRAARYFS